MISSLLLNGLKGVKKVTMGTNEVIAVGRWKYDLGSDEHGLSQWTREQLIRTREAIDRVLADDEQEPFLPKPKRLVQPIGPENKQGA
jgi:hypothetical protein